MDIQGHTVNTLEGHRGGGKALEVGLKNEEGKLLFFFF